MYPEDEVESFFLVTDRGYYELASLQRTPRLPPTVGRSMLPSEFRGRTVAEVRRWECCAVILLENGSVIVFDYTWNPFVEKSFPGVDFQSGAEAAEWRDEYLSMSVVD